MNILEKYEKPFQYGAMMLNLLMAYQFFMLWYQPTVADIEKITTFIGLMIFEFIMVHSGVFMAVMPKRISLFVMVPFYSLFAFAFNSLTNDNTILILYCVVVFNRMRYAFSDVTPWVKSKVILNSFLSVAIYFVLIFAVIFLQFLIPYLGLTPEFLEQSQFLETIEARGELIEKPHITMCFGVIYYICLTLVEAYFIKRDALKKDANFAEETKNVAKAIETE